ncbi:hypothetical protein [Egicoccus sp. AB-alg2]|uniref:hypothetical protein n=1 Tax=Egicoccus sp. AB-alg2 TaxID=3242693 RepID=UPI00359DB0D6
MSCNRVALARRCVLAVLVGALAACTGADSAAPEEPTTTDRPPGDEADPAEADPDQEASAEPARDCAADGPPDALTDLTGDDPAAVARAVSDMTHRCADVVVVAAAGDAWAPTLAAPLAAAAEAPLLLVDDDVATVVEALHALEPTRIVTVGLGPEVLAGTDLPAEVAAVGAEPRSVDGSDAETDDASEDADTADTGDTATDGSDPDADTADAGSEAAALALAVLTDLDSGHVLAFDAGHAGARAAALSRADEGLPLLPLPTDDEALQATVTELPASVRLETLGRNQDDAQALADRLVDLGVDAEAATAPRFATDPSEVAWLADPGDTASYAVAAAAAGARGEVLLPIDGAAPWRGAARTARLRTVAPDRIALLGSVDPEAAAWQLPIVLAGPPLPGGGYTLFEGERMVALYGTPGSTALGALGEQDLPATIDRLREVAEPYGADGHAVLPAFEIITTVASAAAEPTGDYSRRIDPETLRPWIERAAEEGIYVILDLQPGRTDFLDQAREYEDLLRLPHVGLALDPEWRLEDDEVHLRQIGSVEAAEVQRVADWLAELVRDEQLPQKLLLLHQFRFSMLPDRDTIEVGPELAGVVHMDGQGPLGTKYETYDAITAGAEDRWLWGWKNFYDEDSPTATPAQVLDLDPLPVFVSYQ